VDKLCLREGCKKILTGKQRLFCSDACRMRYGRGREKSEQKSEQECSVLFANRSVLTANRSLFTNKREFTITFTVVFVSGHNPGEWDLGLLDVSTKSEIARIIQNYLEYAHQGWQITVKLESKPQFKPFE
jgi:hypothetical protein